MTPKENPLATLRRLARPPSPLESCEFCNTSLPGAHRHLLELATRKIICACDPCALRFENVIGRWKLIPRDTRLLPSFQITDAQWEALALPINLAFIFQSSAARKVVAMYPSPAGATESLLPIAAWEILAAENPDLALLETDVAALLVNRLGDTREYFMAPIDVCFELVGLIRVHWRGLSGGDKVWREIETFFTKLKPELTHA
ncbi:MAG TPA: DUF5947 family protein [Verrucomicrobiae bacterium]|jgi:hypothetical protein|nr:DUF5947 family protein [Verrucomicrobiae bacterium]